MSTKREFFALIGLAAILATVNFFLKRYCGIDLKGIFHGVFLGLFGVLIFRSKKRKENPKKIAL
jgi:hypothetical protein